ncbi:TetR/AcrR family transcriptional regulator [Brachybacterium sp. ACRRE]|uniref:TetR/AcrR family transcriptional regulator n=1 Tax=Brachybacterium sp. ACRRE TaxID=2918184 RepID=UPI001EF29D9F|nr:TetR/AcrR family transcriptional regulator [Brachybacterium sp. ACRRE]MCG7311397.1 TetR/AcrR family transcriptional regulator [Brachybacterium sp. ACRRE]
MDDAREARGTAPPADPDRTAHLTPGAQRILEAAGPLFYENGIHAVGVDTIAEVSGVTKRTLYDRFGSKDALVATYLQLRDEAWRRTLETHVAAASPPRALAVFEAYEDAEQTDRGCAFLNAAGELPPDHPGQAMVRAHKAHVRMRLGALVEEYVESPAAEDVAEHLFLLLEGAIAHRGIDGDAHRLRDARRLATQLLTRCATPQ